MVTDLQGPGSRPGRRTSAPWCTARWLRDDYLMWAIGAGGAAFGTGMPAFKDALAEDARWKIIRYLRTL